MGNGRKVLTGNEVGKVWALLTNTKNATTEKKQKVCDGGGRAGLGEGKPRGGGAM